MVLKLHGNSNLVAHACNENRFFFGEKNPIGFFFGSRDTEIAPYVRTYFCVPIYYKYHGANKLLMNRLIITKKRESSQREFK